MTLKTIIWLQTIMRNDKPIILLGCQGVSCMCKSIELDDIFDCNRKEFFGYFENSIFEVQTWLITTILKNPIQNFWIEQNLSSNLNFLI